MSRFLAKTGILLGSVIAAAFLTFCHPTPQQLVPYGVGEAEVRAAPGTPAGKIKYQLSALRVFNQAMVKISDNYVDPDRVHPREMLLGALDSVQRNIPEVLVEPAADKNSVNVTVNDKTQSFFIGDVSTPWKLTGRLKEIFTFVEGSMNPGQDAAQIEYAAVNGMLGTLDPHSILLDPEQARDMDISTSGKFGGIGIVIRMPKGKLTVVSLISPETPAAKAGLKPGDHIVRINDEPTANLTLNEAMNRLRGDPNTRVVVAISRGGAAPVDYTITRAVIRVSSVKSKLLEKQVGYVKIESFSSDTGRDTRRAVEELKAAGARAYVLDLRGNPGGLLDQAVAVANVFVDSGTIVTTVGNAGTQREEKRAKPGSVEPKAPLVVLVNSGSASASEIVAGALKNLDRAIVVGQTTFGKGSVQVLFDFADGSKLKLTIAQYLTPGDVSIQSVGIAPDIELVPVLVPKEVKTPKDAIRLLGMWRRSMHEADLDSHLTSKNVQAAAKPIETVRYLYTPRRPAFEDDEENLDEPPAPEDEIGEATDFEIQLARDLAAAIGSAARRGDALLGPAKSFLARRRGDEEGRIAAALAVLGIDWAVGPKGAPALVASVTTDKPDNRVAAGEIIAVTGQVTNTGKSPAYRVRAHASSDDYAFEFTELVFGRIDPGATRSFTTFVKVPADADDRASTLEWQWSEENGAVVAAAATKILVAGKPRPTFAYTYQLIDDQGKDNGDGLLQLGESLRLRATVKNVGVGEAAEAEAVLRSKSGDGLMVKKGRYELGRLAPGAEKTVDFTFDVYESFGEPAAVLELGVFDNVLRAAAAEKVTIPVRAPVAVKTSVGAVRCSRAELTVREGAALDAPVIGKVTKGAVLKQTGRAGDWIRVAVDADRPGFVEASAVAATSAAPAANLATAWRVTPPIVKVAAGGALESVGERYRLRGEVSDDTHVEDVYVLVSNRDAKVDGKKVYYLSNRGKNDGKRLTFDADIPLYPGSNQVTIVARENDEVRTVETVYILRTDGVAAK